MSFKCSVFGHDFGPTETVREQHQDGNEVVTTVREIKTCSRCDKVRTVTENTEVTRVDPAPEQDAEGEDSLGHTEADKQPAASANQGLSTVVSGSSAPAGSDPDRQTATHDGGTAEQSPDSRTGEDASPDPETLSTLPEEPASGVEHASPEDDDGVILDDEGDPRAPGEWPDRPDPSEDTEQVPWPDDADDDTTTEDPSPNPGEADDSDSVDADADPEPASETADTEDPDIEPTGGAITVPRGQFRCPECGYTEAVEASSLRTGDFCPECRTGTLDHITE